MAWGDMLDIPHGICQIHPMEYVRYTPAKSFEVWLQWDRSDDKDHAVTPCFTFLAGPIGIASVQLLEIISYKVQKLHGCTCVTPEVSYMLFGFKLRVRVAIQQLAIQLQLASQLMLLDGLLKGTDKMYNRLSRVFGGCNLRRYGLSYI